MKKLLLAGTFVLCIAFYTNAQKMSIDNVRKMYSGNFAPIKEGTDVKGYYFFYISDKIDKKTNEYTLHIVDNGLKFANGGRHAVVLRLCHGDSRRDASLANAALDGSCGEPLDVEDF